MKKIYSLSVLGIPLCLTFGQIKDLEPLPLMYAQVNPLFFAKDSVPTPLTLAEIIPSSFVKVYETSFENVASKNAHQLVWDFPHWFEYAARHREDGGKGNGIGGARMWVDNARAHTGRKSIGLEVFDIERSRRSQFLIFPKKYVNKEYYISYWLFLPSDWGLFDSTINWDWFEIGNPYFSNGEPYAAVFISKPDEKQKYFTVSLGIRDQERKLSTVGEKRILLPKNRWFQVCYYVRRDKKNGEVSVWFDGQLIAEKSGFPTANTSHDNFTVSIAKIYHERGDKVAHKLWIDDFTLYASRLN